MIRKIKMKNFIENATPEEFKRFKKLFKLNELIMAN